MSLSDKSVLLVDIGNSAIKWCLGDGDIHAEPIESFNLGKLPIVDEVLVSCVGDCELLSAVKNTHFVKTQSAYKTLRCGYQNPSELGVDRWLAMIAVVEQYSNQSVLVIDAGSALTFDLILASGEHQGGLIMPGLSVLRSSFDQFSTNSQQIRSHNLANNTKDAWEFGTGYMLISAINAQIERHLDDFGDLIVVLTGGDSKIIALRLNYQVKLHQNLVLEGLSNYAQTYKV